MGGWVDVMDRWTIWNWNLWLQLPRTFLTGCLWDPAAECNPWNQQWQWINYESRPSLVANWLLLWWILCTLPCGLLSCGRSALPTFPGSFLTTGCLFICASDSPALSLLYIVKVRLPVISWPYHSPTFPGLMHPFGMCFTVAFLSELFIVCSIFTLSVQVE